MRVQKLLHPQADEPAQLLLVHPPGGIAGGDRLQLDLELAAGVACLVSTPGATRWYRSTGPLASQCARVKADAGAKLEWLPQDAIVQNQADALQELEIDLAGDAAVLGWDLVQLGQPLAGRPWLQGRWRQRFELRREGRLLLADQAELTPADLHDSSPQILAGFPVFASLWASGGRLTTDAEAALEAARAAVAAVAEPGMPVHCGLSWLGPPVECLVLRALAHDALALRQALIAVWSVLRPVVIGAPARLPRIWRT